MAEGYAQATGKPGVAMVTSGPPATNIVTPLCDAYLDSIPMVVITDKCLQRQSELMPFRNVTQRESPLLSLNTTS